MKKQPWKHTQRQTQRPPKKTPQYEYEYEYLGHPMLCINQKKKQVIKQWKSVKYILKCIEEIKRYIELRWDYNIMQWNVTKTIKEICKLLWRRAKLWMSLMFHQNSVF